MEEKAKENTVYCPLMIITKESIEKQKTVFYHFFTPHIVARRAGSASNGVRIWHPSLSKVNNVCWVEYSRVKRDLLFQSLREWQQNVSKWQFVHSLEHIN